MGYLVVMENMLRYFDQWLFCKVLSIGPINVCTNFEINGYKIDKFIKHSKVMAQTVVLMFLMTLTFDLCSIDLLKFPCEVS